MQGQKPQELPSLLSSGAVSDTLAQRKCSIEECADPLTEFKCFEILMQSAGHVQNTKRTRIWPSEDGIDDERVRRKSAAPMELSLVRLNEKPTPVATAPGLYVKRYRCDLSDPTTPL